MLNPLRILKYFIGKSIVAESQRFLSTQGSLLVLRMQRNFAVGGSGSFILIMFSNFLLMF
jgi:hypothetical protein